MKDLRSLVALLIGVSMSLTLWGEVEASAPKIERLKQELAALRTRATRLEKENQTSISTLQATKTELAGSVEALRDKKRSLESSVAKREEGLQKEPQKRVDSVTFASGRKVTCLVRSYRNHLFTLEDGDGNQIKVYPRALTGITFRSETQADVFPDHVLNPVATGPTSLPTPTPKANRPFEIKEHMVVTRITRKRSSESIDEIQGYVDEVADSVQYTCRVEARALPDDVQGLRMRIWVLAESTVNEDVLKLVIASEKRFDLPRIGEVEFDSDEVVLKYDDRGAKYGHKLYGWVFLLEDEKGNAIHLKRNKKKLADNLDRIRSMSLNEEITL